jgi:glucosamine-6-phosphate deaminase
MIIDVSETKEEMSIKGRDFIISELRKNETLQLGGATGSTPKRLYELLAEKARKGKLDLSRIGVWFLDEYFGRMNYYLYAVNAFHNAFPKGKGIKLENIHIPRGIYYNNNQIVHSDILDRILKTTKGRQWFEVGPEIRIIKTPGLNLTLEQIGQDVESYENQLPRNRLQILGLGVEGHIGFNEAGTSETSLTHLTLLADSTVKANAEDYADGIVTRYAITQGIKSIMNAKMPVLFANDKKKADAVYGMFVGNNVASCLRKHPNARVYLTRDALARFNYFEREELKKEHEVSGII